MIVEKYEFTSKARNTLLIIIAVGLVLAIGGLAIEALSGGHGHEAAHDSTVHNEHVVTDADHSISNNAEELHEEGEHGHASVWFRRLVANLWINSVFFLGLGIIGLFFFAIQYAAQAGWSAGFLRVPLAIAQWVPYAALILIAVFIIAYPSHALFHWLDTSLYDVDSPNYDPIIAGKSWYLSQPFYIARMIVFLGLWIVLVKKLSSLAYSEDELSDKVHNWYKLRKWSAIFLVIFAVTSSMAAWDWIMSIDTHWFSTMFGWYTFASWWVSGLALILFIVVLLKDSGYLALVNANHIHDLGKFVFAFSIFWTYIWFSQFLLIYYANIPEETIYFLERWKSDHYAPVFFTNLVLNFFLPFLLLMTRDSKRHARILKVVCPIVIFGHWLDFYLMITPGTLQDNGGFGILELGLFATYAGAFLLVVLSSLSKKPLVAKNHPMVQESLHHHI